MNYANIKNWEEYQHYRDRCPPWIKLHVKILNDKDFTALSCASRGLLIQLWILASENEGKTPINIEEIKFRLRDNSIKEKDVNLLIDKGFLVGCKQMLADASELLAKDTGSVSVSVSVSPKEGESEGENTQFELFWQAYPKKKSKGQAEKAWLKIKPNEQLLEAILSTIEQAKTSVDWTKDGGQFIPYPATWLNAKGWEDEYGKQGDGAVDDNLFLQALAEQDKQRGIS